MLLDFTVFVKVVLFFFSVQSLNTSTTDNDIKINTTECSWKIRGTPIVYGNLTMHQFLGASLNHGPHVYGVCTFHFCQPLDIQRSSVVDINGRHSLAIKSNESIQISSPFLLDWSPGKNRSDTWLGGFCSRDDDPDRSYGYGPGGGDCYGSAGHGGMGIDFRRGLNGTLYGWRYGFNTSNPALIGGSSGGAYLIGSGLSCGGGAIMISSETAITIDAKISTNAYNLVTNDSSFYGASGGTIIIKAQKVYLTANASLVSKGTPATIIGGSGSGGVIVVNGSITGHTPDPQVHTRPDHKSFVWESYGVVIINGESRDRLQPLATIKDSYSGCYSTNQVFTYSILHDFMVRPSSCRRECKACGYRYAVLHVKSCACVDYLDGMTRVSDSECSVSCFTIEKIRCGGSNMTHTFYMVYNANVNSTLNKTSNISTTNTCPKKEIKSYCTSRPITTTTSLSTTTTSLPTTTTSLPTTTTSLHTTTTSLPTTTTSLPTTITSLPTNTSSLPTTTTSLPTTTNSLPTNTSLLSTTPSTSSSCNDKSTITEKLQELSRVTVTKNNSAEVLKRLFNLTATDVLSAENLNSSLSIFEKIVEKDAIVSKDKTESKRFGQLVLKIADNLLNNSESSWSVLKKAEKWSPEIVLKFVEQAAVKLGRSLHANDTLSFNSTNFDLRIERVVPSQLRDRTYLFSARGIEQSDAEEEMNEGEVVFVPASLSDAIYGAGPFNLNLLKYRPHSTLVNASLKNSTARSILASNIIAISVSRPLKKDLEDKVVLSFPKSKFSTTDARRSCRFLDFEEESEISWSTRGCVMGSDKEGRIECLCSHFTSFAVLIETEQVTIDEVHIEALNWITYLGCTVSLICLIVTLTTFAVLKNMVCDHVWIHCNLIVSLTLAQFVFIFGIKATETKIVCQAIAIALQYFFTASIFWMCVEGIHLYRKVVKVFMKSSVKKYYYVFAWGGPALMVLFSALLRFDGFGSEKACWLSTNKGLIWAFAAPVLALFVVNLVILLLVIRIMLVAVNTIPPTGQNSSIRNGVKGVIFLLPILGLTWVFGVVAVNSAAVVFQYIFTILNSLQGFFIFLFHCVLNKDVRAALKKRQQRKTTTRRWSNESSWKSKEQNKSSLQTSRVSNPFVKKIDVKPLPEPLREAVWGK